MAYASCSDRLTRRSVLPQIVIPIASAIRSKSPASGSFSILMYSALLWLHTGSRPLISFILLLSDSTPLRPTASWWKIASTGSWLRRLPEWRYGVSVEAAIVEPAMPSVYSMRGVSRYLLEWSSLAIFFGNASLEALVGLSSITQPGEDGGRDGCQRQLCRV